MLCEKHEALLTFSLSESILKIRFLAKGNDEDSSSSGKATESRSISLMQDASRLYGWNLDLGKIASIFRAGCIIQAVFLNDITHAFEAEPKPENLIFDGFFLSRINEHQDSLRQAVSTGVMNGLPIPALCNAVSYLDEFRAKAAGANLIQAQRDCFGAHTYERTDREGVFHHEWRWANDNQH